MKVSIPLGTTSKFATSIAAHFSNSSFTLEKVKSNDFGYTCSETKSVVKEFLISPLLGINECQSLGVSLLANVIINRLPINLRSVKVFILGSIQNCLASFFSNTCDLLKVRFLFLSNLVRCRATL